VGVDDLRPGPPALEGGGEVQREVGLAGRRGADQGDRADHPADGPREGIPHGDPGRTGARGTPPDRAREFLRGRRTCLNARTARSGRCRPEMTDEQARGAVDTAAPGSAAPPTVTPPTVTPPAA